MTDFPSAAVIGTGMMGPGIAAVLALGGVRSAIVSRTAEGAAEGLRAAQRSVELLRANGLATDAAAAWAVANLSSSCGFEEAIRGAGLVIESAPEDMAFKQELFARMDAIAPAEAVLASNTSGLSISAIASRCTRPERVLTTHFWNPPHLMPLVEVIRGERTDAACADAVVALLRRCGKVPVLVRKDRPGQLGNRLQFALYREAMNIVAEGIADAADVDTALKNGFGLRLPVYGIFEHQDAVGLDLSLSVAEYVIPDLCSEPEAPAILRELVAAGKLGAKTGEGFYDWSKKDLGAVKDARDRFVLDFVKRRRAEG